VKLDTLIHFEVFINLKNLEIGPGGSPTPDMVPDIRFDKNQVRGDIFECYFTPNNQIENFLLVGHLLTHFGMKSQNSKV